MLRRLTPEGFEEALEKRRTQPYPEEVEAKVKEILEGVKKGGDAALLEYTRLFDRVVLPKEKLEVPREEARLAWEKLSRPLAQALDRAWERITSYHRREPLPQWRFQDDQGSWLGQLWRPLDRVGVYVPGGSAPLLSTALMTVIPARVAGVKEVILCTPPGPNGRPDANLLAAAWRAGVDRIFAVGGAQAIAALAFGTETIPRVDKIVGPGNAYVTLAKKLVYGQVGIDLLAGPSEVAVLADETASGEEVAADLIAQAEHDPLAWAVLITPSRRLLEEVDDHLRRQVTELARRDIAQRALANGGMAVLVPDLKRGIELVNVMAPEHLELLLAEPWEILADIRQAGAVFLGPFSPEALGDYVAGPSHVLPTGGTARFSSVLSVNDFVRKISLIAATPETFRQEAPWAAVLADLEGLTGHAAALRRRLKGGEVGSATTAPGAEAGARHLPDSPGDNLRRRAEVIRRTRETSISLELSLDGGGRTEISTGLPFFDHLLEQIGRHAGFDLLIQARGDLEVDQHHLVEDVGICLGEAIFRALGAKEGINRYGQSLLPMDEALALVAVDLSGRPYLSYDVSFPAKRVGAFELALVEEFWRAVTANGRLTLHLRLLAGRNSHHMVESLFKGAGRALGQATRRRSDGVIPSTKGLL